MAVPGDVIVVDGGGDLTNALIGEIMSHMAAVKGLGGFVINGSIRDAKSIKANSFPVFALGVTHRGPYKDGPGEINTKISIDGMVIDPGDLIIGDDDGCLCVPIDSCSSVYSATQAKSLAEQKMIADITSGSYSDAWVDEALNRLGCSIEI
jgi:regulator of RNase E activity RraA